MEKRQFREETVESTTAWREGDNSSLLPPSLPIKLTLPVHLTRELEKSGEETV